jgi:hypothetical protein
MFHVAASKMDKMTLREMVVGKWTWHGPGDYNIVINLMPKGYC